MDRTALITGITGQDGSYLAEYLLDKDYEVYGLKRWKSTSNEPRIDHLKDKITLLSGDLADQNSIDRVLINSEPDEVYNLASLSHVPQSFNQPVYSGEITALGVTKVLEAIRKHQPQARFYQAGTSEMFGNSKEKYQSESTPFDPCSPYATSKLYGHYITKNYRNAYGIHASNGILFNHESPRRGTNFVTRKVSRGIAEIIKGTKNTITLGNLEAKRDWGHAKDYVRAMHMMVRNEEPVDYVVGTGNTHSVKEMVKIAFDEVDLDWKDHVETSGEYMRPTDIDVLRADSSKIRKDLGWEPEISFEEMISDMVQADLRRVEKNT